jgi:hypothetical protein
MIKATKQKISTLRSHEGFMRYFANTSWLFGEKILRMIVGLFTTIATLGLDGIVASEIERMRYAANGDSK